LFAEGEEGISIRAARNAFFVLLVISAGFIPFKPEVVVDNNYLGGIIPGFTYRYAGLTPQANHLGQITTLYLLCLWNQPFSKRWLNIFGWTIGYASLVFAQSKTSWISFFICMPCMGYFKYGAYLKQRLFDVKNPVLPMALILMTMGTAAIMLGMIMFSDVPNKVSLFFSTRAGADLMTMTGRIRIWDAAIHEWRSSPLFGYGLTIWDDAHRARIGIPVAFHAHNQFYQTLASAGVTGATGLIIYVITLIRFTLKTARSSQGLTLAILLMLFLQSISEVPLAISGHFSYDAITHLLLLMIIGGQFKPDRVKKSNKSLTVPQRLILSRGLS
jgi:O-antigen ligase